MFTHKLFSLFYFRPNMIFFGHFVPSRSVNTYIHAYTVRLLTHVLCKPTHFFFHSFIATMSYSLQTSFNSLMKDCADKYHVWGTPTRSPSRSNSRLFKHVFFHTKKEHIDMCSYIISVVLMLYHILFEGVCFVLSYPTHIWNAYVPEFFLEIINAKNEACL